MGSSAQKLDAHDARRKRIAVIGAGPAGLVTAKTLIQRGADVVVYERGNAVGGTWRWGAENGRQFLYKNLHINTSKRLTAFEGYPFPADTQPIPDHRDMARYMQGYAERFSLLDRTRLNTSVESVVRVEGAPRRWVVRSSDGDEAIYDAVVVCTGPFNRPQHVPEFADFGGEYVHSADYREPGAYVGKRVCIVGAGNSAVDIASDICTTADRVVLIARSPVFVLPHTIFGVNFNDVSRALQAWWIPSGLRRRISRTLVRIVHGRMTDHGFRPLTHRVHGTISSTIIQDILFRRVVVKNGITAINGQNLEFSDGTSEQFDALIAATGFVTEFPFLPQGAVAGQGNRLSLYNRIVPPGQPGLYFVGMINIDTPINFACERQAKWIAEVELKGAMLPDVAEMQRSIAQKNAWVRKHYGEAARHSVQEESKIYYRELDRSLRCALRRRHLASSASRHESELGAASNASV